MPLIDVGAKAPDFTLKDQDGKTHTLSDYAGRTLVLYFYPKDDTSGCTDQACQFRDHTPDFSKIGAAVLGVSPDDEKSHAKFAAKHGLTFPLLADTERDEANNPKVCEAYGVWGEKSMYGRKYMGVIRTTYLIDAEGVVRKRWDKVSVPGHAEEVLAAVRELEGLPAEPPARRKVAKKAGTKKKAATRKRSAARKRPTARKKAAAKKKPMARKKPAARKKAAVRKKRSSR